MKTKCKACKGRSGDQSCKACGGAGHIEKMTESDSEDYDMKKASEVLKGLRELDVTEADAQRIVKGQIEKGEIQDDLDTAALDVDALDEAVDAMKASLSGDYTADDPAGDLVAKGGGDDLFEMLNDGDGMVDLGDAFGAIAQADANVAKGLNTLHRETGARFEVVTKGLMAVAKLLRDQTRVFKSQAEAIGQIQDRQDQIAKAMGQPIPPRSVLTGATAIPAPHEGAVAKGGIEPGQQAEPEQLNHFVVLKAAQAEFGEIVKGGTVDPNTRYRAAELRSAIAKCENGGGGLTPQQIVEQFKIRVA